MTQNWNEQPWSEPDEPVAGGSNTLLRVIAAAVVAAVAATAVLWLMGGFGSRTEGSGSLGPHGTIGTKTTSPAVPSTAGGATPSTGGVDSPVSLTGGPDTGSGSGSEGGGGSGAPAKPTAAVSTTAKSAATYTGPCTQTAGSNTFTFTAQVSVSKGPADVILWWTQADGTTTPTKTVHFAGSGLQQQAMDFTFAGVNYTFAGSVQAHVQIGTGATVDSNKSAFSQTCSAAKLALTTPEPYNTVQQGQYYTATATGFLPGEAIAFSFGGQAAGTIGTYIANSAGAADVQVGPMGGNYGTYTIYARGSKTSAQATQTLKLTPVPYMTLSRSSLVHGQTYVAYADHFQPYETITFFVTGAANATVGTVVADGYGNGSITVTSLPNTGSFTVHASGNTSHLGATAALTAS